MSERASYSRVYWSIVDDPKFVTVYDEDRHLAAWLRLLLIADQAHPASAHLPVNVKPSSVTVLAEVGLIDLLPGSRYRVHGLDAERDRRRQAATSRGPNGPDTQTRLVTERSPNGPGTQSLRRDETRQAEDEPTARANDPYDDTEGEALSWLARHGCDIRPGNGYHQKLVVAVEQHGSDAVIGMFDRLARAGTKNGDVKGFLFNAIDALNARTRPNVRLLEAEEREQERSEAFADRAARTRARNAELAKAISAATPKGTA